MECDKKSFANQREATVEIIGIQRRVKKHKFRPYVCRECGKWHITTITKHDLPKLKEKYPFKLEQSLLVKPKKLKPPSGPQTTNKIKTEHPFITKQQAEALKRIIDNGNK